MSTQSSTQTSNTPSSNTSDASPETFPTLKRFLNKLKTLGKLRLVATNDAAVMESICTTDNLFYASIPKGEYANIIDMKLNLDMHLRLAGVGGARFETGKSRGGGGGVTYVVRVLGVDGVTVVMSMFLMWDKYPEDVEEERIEAWKLLKEEFVTEGDTVMFDEL